MAMDGAGLRALLRKSFKEEGVVIFVGSGVSITAARDPSGKLPPCASWSGLLKEGISCAATGEDAVADADSWKREQLARLQVGDAASFTQVAQEVRVQLDGCDKMTAFLQRAFRPMVAHNRSLKEALMRAKMHGASFATTNYDDLLGEMLGEVPVHRSDTALVVDWVEHGRGIFHAHGHFSRAADVVLGVDDYDAVLKDESTQYALSSFSHKTVLFLGAGPAGLSDPNISKLLALMARLDLGRRVVLARSSELCKFPGDQVQPVSYGDNFSDFVPFLQYLFSPDEQILSPPASGGKTGPFMISPGNGRYLCMKKSDTEHQEIFLRTLDELGDCYFHFYLVELDDARVMIYIETDGKLLTLSPGVSVTTLRQVYHRHRLCAGQLGVVSFDLVATASQWVSGRSNALLLSWKEHSKRFFFKSVRVGWPGAERWEEEISTTKTDDASKALSFTLHGVNTYPDYLASKKLEHERFLGSLEPAPVAPPPPI